MEDALGSQDDVGFGFEGKTPLFCEQFECSDGLGLEKHFKMKGVMKVSNIIPKSSVKTPGCFRSAAR